MSQYSNSVYSGEEDGRELLQGSNIPHQPPRHRDRNVAPLGAATSAQMSFPGRGHARGYSVRPEYGPGPDSYGSYPDRSGIIAPFTPPLRQMQSNRPDQSYDQHVPAAARSSGPRVPALESPGNVVQTDTSALGQQAGRGLRDLSYLRQQAELVIDSFDNDPALGTLSNKFRQLSGQKPAFVVLLDKVQSISKKIASYAKHDSTYYAHLEDFRLQATFTLTFEQLFRMLTRLEIVIGEKSLVRKTRSKMITGLGELHYNLGEVLKVLQGVLNIADFDSVLVKIRACRALLKVQNNPK